ncbi:WD40 repeat domain-containing protein [Deinococcus sp. UYEF24]
MYAILLLLLACCSLALSAPASLQVARTFVLPDLGHGPLAVDHSGNVLGVENGRVVLSTPIGKLIHDFGGLSAKAFPTVLSLTNDGRTALGLTPYGQHGAVWDTVSGKVLWEPEATLAHFLPDGQTLVLLEGTRLVKRNALNGALLWSQTVLKQPEPDVALAVSPDGQAIALLERTSVWVVRARNGQRLWTTALKVPAGPPESQDVNPSPLTFSRNGRTLYAASEAELVRIEARTGHVQARRAGHQPYALADTLRGLVLASGPDIQLLDPFSLQTHATLHGHAEDILSLVTSRDGTTLWSADPEVTIRWTLKTLVTSTFGKVRAATLSADGRTLAVSLGDTSVRLLDAHTGARKRMLSGFAPPPVGLGSINAGHQLGSVTLKFSPDGHFLLAGTSQVWRGVPKARPDPSVLRLYSATSGRLLASWDGAPAYRVAFSRDSQHLMSTAQGLHAFLFSADTGEQGMHFLPVQFGTPEANLSGSLPTFLHGRPAILGTLRQADGVHATLWVGARTLVQGGVLRGTSTFSASPGLHWIAAQGDSGLTVWNHDTAKIQVQRPADTSFSEGEAALLFSPDDRLLAGQVCPGAARGCGLHLRLQLWEAATGTVLASRESDDVPFAVQNDGSLWTLSDGTLKVWR